MEQISKEKAVLARSIIQDLYVLVDDGEDTLIHVAVLEVLEWIFQDGDKPNFSEYLPK